MRRTFELWLCFPLRLLLEVCITEVLIDPVHLAFFSILLPAFLYTSLSFIHVLSLTLALPYDCPLPFIVGLWPFVLTTLEVLNKVRVRGAPLMALLTTFLFQFL